MSEDAELMRFVDAQARIYDTVTAELRAGRKRTHWMWFVFPQIAGLGRSVTAQQYAIASLDEARAYLAHPVLGARLRECTRLVLAADAASAQEIFGGIDSLKLRSSMTLFARAADDDSEFTAVLAKHFGGDEDPLTVERLTG